MSNHPKRLGFFTRLLDDVPAGERYRLATEQIRHAERFGYHSAWVAQHHFHPDEGGLPSPAVFLAHVAARTTTIRLGTGVITLPMENPVRVAEDAAVLDLVANGRLELGFGTGGTRESFEVFGVEPDKRGEVYAHYLQTLRRAFRGEDLHACNRLYPPAGQLLERFWMATFSPFGGKLAGESGDGLLLSRNQPRPSDQPDIPLDELQNPIIDAYLAALPKGHEPRIMASRTLFVSENRAAALQYAEAGLRKAAPRLTPERRHAATGPLEELIRITDSHVGTPDDVIKSLQADSALQRATDIVFQVHSIDPPHSEILRSIELAAAEVAPALGITLTQPAQSHFATGYQQDYLQ